ncbi:MAG: hypothetical protein M3Y65_19030 [Pseudomonadota bacterium]|nr:hypothetical protein [Pseudomonadota bacterium]
MVEHLPKSAQNLIALIGLPSTLRLVDTHGGITVNLYNSENSLERMAEIVGPENARALLKFYGSVPFTVPMCMHALKAVRNAEILAEFDRLTQQEKLSARASVTLITRRFTPHIHERTIWRILKTLPDSPPPLDDRQGSLI